MWLKDGAKRYNCTIIDLFYRSPVAALNSNRINAEFVNHHSFESDEALKEGTSDYIFVYYNHIRPHSANGYLTPFEKRFNYCLKYQCWCYNFA